MPTINRYNEQHVMTAQSRIHGAEYSLLNADKTGDYFGRNVVCFAMHAELRCDGYEALVEKVKQTVGDRLVWISFDIDAMDAAYCPGTTIPMHNGTTTEDIAMIFLKLSQAGLNVVGGEITELIPDLDVPTKITCGFAARVMRDIAYLSYQEAQRQK